MSDLSQRSANGLNWMPRVSQVLTGANCLVHGQLMHISACVVKLTLDLQA